VLTDFEGVAVGPMTGVDGIGFVLVEAEIAEHEIGHRLVQVAEEQHLANQVFVAAQQFDDAVAGAQALEIFRMVAFEQFGFELGAAQLSQARVVAGGGQQFGAGVKRQQVLRIDVAVDLDKAAGLQRRYRGLEIADFGVIELAEPEAVVTAVEQADAEFAGIVAEGFEIGQESQRILVEDVGIEPRDVAEQGQHVVEVIGCGQIRLHGA
jgi:hypothetical protein